MEWRTWPDAATFLDAAGAHLRADVLVNQMPLGIATNLVSDPLRYGPGPNRFHTVHDAHGACVGAVVHTPPYIPGLSDMALSVAAFAGARFAADHPDVNGAFGLDDVALSFATAAGAARTLTCTESMGLFALHAVADLPRAPGHRRVATHEDAPLLQRWLRAFHEEAVPTDPPIAPDHGARAAERARTHLWLDDGEPVALTSYGRDLEGYVSVGPVYTPPALRGRGYATTLVAEMSALALAEGRVGCTLFTDLANPTSNRIYQRIGYVRIGTMKRLALGQAAPNGNRGDPSPTE